jgi:4-hydroxyphenylpyruvate dioxygenase
MTSPCGKIRIPINESSDDKSQIQEYLEAYHGEGIQHIALGSGDIYATVDALKHSGVELLDTPDTYYEALDARLPGHGEPVAELQKRRILLDGGPALGHGAGDTVKDGLLLQIFTKTVIGPIFFEIIQRKGDEGFGEGNFRALFESIELDQIRRGVLKPGA